ncbi:ABC transporter permease [candidate division KSB1 bacterium]
MKKSSKKPPVFARWLISKLGYYEKNFALKDALVEEYREIREKHGTAKAFFWYWFQTFEILFQYFKVTIYWSFTMFKNYLKVAFRNFRRQKSFSAINILGLAVGITCSILILLYINFELSYDTYHKDADRIYRINRTLKTKNGIMTIAYAPNMLGPTLKSTFPQVEDVSRIVSFRPVTVKYGERKFKQENMRVVEPGLFNILNISFIKGDPSSALERPNTVVLTEEAARKYFGDEDPIGRNIEIGTVVYKTRSPFYEITGIVTAPPQNTFFKYEFLFSWKSLEPDEHTMQWAASNPTFIKLDPAVKREEFEAEVTQLCRDNMEDFLKSRGAEISISLTPVKDIHLYSNLMGELETPGNPVYIYIFSAVGILILLTASLNFINLSTARSANRSTEVGMRKIVGAQRAQLIRQFIGESALSILTAFVIAVVVTAVILPFFNQIVQMDFSAGDFLNTKMMFYYILILICISVVSSIYPAIFLSSFRPAQALKGIVQSGSRSGRIRKILVVSQFTISITLIIGTIIFFSQLDFMKNKDYGINMKQKIVIDMQDNNVGSNFKSIKDEFQHHSGIEGATFSSAVPGRRTYRWRLWPTGKKEDNSLIINCIGVDMDFFKEFDIDFAVGVEFDPENVSRQSIPGMILNETAVKAFGWNSAEEALTKTLMDSRDRIIGVVRDFHFTGLQNLIEPAAIFYLREDFRFLILSVSTDDINRTISFIEEKYNVLFPGQVFTYFFLDEDFRNQYQTEEQLGRILSAFTILAILIACMGLFGLASFMAEQKTKEIGIRKVLGASNLKIVSIFSMEFFKCMLISGFIACPLSYYISHRWLLEFAYRIKIGIFPFLLSVFFVAIIVFLTVSYQSLKAAAANPVDSLRIE